MSIIHKTAKGKEVDMNRLATQNELTVAVSNVKINARGDELGPGGQIIRKTEDAIPAGVPVEQRAIRKAPAKPAPKPAPKPAVHTAPVVQAALVQPVLDNLSTPEKIKGKQ